MGCVDKHSPSWISIIFFFLAIEVGITRLSPRARPLSPSPERLQEV